MTSSTQNHFLNPSFAAWLHGRPVQAMTSTAVHSVSVDVVKGSSGHDMKSRPQEDNGHADAAVAATADQQLKWLLQAGTNHTNNIIKCDLYSIVLYYFIYNLLCYTLDSTLLVQ